MKVFSSLSVLFLAVSSLATVDIHGVSDHPDLGFSIDGPVYLNGKVYFTSNPSLQGKIQPMILRFDPQSGQLTRALLLPRAGRVAGMAKSPKGDLYVADYRRHRVWKVPFQSGQLAFEDFDPQKNLVWKKDSWGQPNDLVIGRRGLVFLADFPKKSEHKGGFWQANTLRPEAPMTLVEKPGRFTGIGMSEKHNRLVLARSTPSCELQGYRIRPKIELVWKKPCQKKWSVDGIQIDGSGTMYLARTGLGRIDIMDVKTGESKWGICTLKGHRGKVFPLRGLDDAVTDCPITSEFQVGQNPTGLDLSGEGDLYVTTQGEYAERHNGAQGGLVVLPPFKGRPGQTEKKD